MTRKKYIFVFLAVALLAKIAINSFSSKRIEETPIYFTEGGLPFVLVTIDGYSCPLLLDLGSKLELGIDPETLDSMNKVPAGIEKWGNFRGNQFIRETYTIPEVKIGSLRIVNPTAVSIERENEDDSIIWQDSKTNTKNSPLLGHIGSSLFQSTNFILDTKRCKIIFTNDSERLKQLGYDLNAFIKIPFQLQKKKIVFPITTELGTCTFFLDTGATHSFIQKTICKDIPTVSSKPLPHILLNTFSIGNQNFGPKKLYPLEVTKYLNDIDGVLGMDFIKKYTLYIDFTHKQLHIKPCEI